MDLPNSDDFWFIMIDYRVKSEALVHDYIYISMLLMLINAVQVYYNICIKRMLLKPGASISRQMGRPALRLD